jgi:hypothetical protein
LSSFFKPRVFDVERFAGTADFDFTARAGFFAARFTCFFGISSSTSYG